MASELRNIEVSLTVGDQNLAIVTAYLRRYRNGQKVLHDKYGVANKPFERLIEDIYGAGAEIAVARMLGLSKWEPLIDTFMDVADIGKDIEVRWINSPSYRLIVREDDPEDRRYVVVSGGLETFRVIGWAYGSECRRVERLEDHHDGRPSAYYTSQSELHGFAEEVVKEGAVFNG